MKNLNGLSISTVVHLFRYKLIFELKEENINFNINVNINSIVIINININIKK